MEKLGNKVEKEFILIYYGVVKFNFDLMLDIYCVELELGYCLQVLLDEGIICMVCWLKEYGKFNMG